MKNLNLLRTKLTAIAILALAAITATAQQTGSGRLVKQEREVPGFTEIEVGNTFIVKLSQGEVCKVFVETENILQDKVETVVEGERLHIRSMGMRNPSALRIFIEAPEIGKLDVNTAAQLESTGTINGSSLEIVATGASKVKLDVNAESLKTDVSGAARVDLSGVAQAHTINATGAANIRALSLRTISTLATVSGASQARVFATELINADISGAGTLYYYDKGKLNKISGIGISKIIPEEAGSEAPEEVTTGIYAGSGDSTLVKIGNIEISVKEGGSTKVIIGDTALEVDDDGNVNFDRKKRQSRFDGHWGGVEIGVNGYVNNSGNFDLPDEYEFLDLRMGKSINFKLNFLEQNFNLIRNKFGLTTGLGFEWKNFRFADDVVLKKFDNTLINENDLFPNDVSYTKSKLVVNYLTLPLLVEYQTNKFSKKNSFHIGGGIETGIRIGSHTKNAFQDDGRKKKSKDPGDYYINPMKYELTARIGWGKINLYANYSLNTLFKSNRAPELYPFTMGITLAGW